MSKVKMSQVEEGLRLAMAFVDAFNQHDTAAIDAIISDGCVFESAGPAPLGLRYEGRAFVTQAIGAFFEAAPDMKMLIEDAYGQGKHSVLRWKIVGLKGAPDARRGVDLFTAQDGRISEILAYAKG